MSTREDGATRPPIESRAELIEWIAAGEKPREHWRIGTEHEKFVFRTEDFSPVPYEGPRGIRAILEEMINRFGWQPIHEGAHIIALKRNPGEPGGNISLEPGGQFELSGAPVRTIHETCQEIHEHLDQVLEVGEALGIGFLGLGHSPTWTRAETPVMPKGRYGIMANYMPKVGSRGLDMMFRTSTVQVNLDFADEADMVRKLRVSLALQPIATAIFANSPFTEGRPNGFLSMRSEIWRDTDNNRSGMLPFAFEAGMGYERYVDYALDVPMYFVYRDGAYIDASGQSFRAFLKGKLPALPGEKPTLDDWSDHMTTLFPEVRLKKFLEMRGADAGRWRRLCALPAFWVGLLYDQAALDAAWDLVKDWTAEERQALRDGVPRTALKTPFRHGRVLDIARQAVAISREGLRRRNNRDEICGQEAEFLAPVERIVESGQTPADELLARYHDAWGGDVRKVFREYAF